MKNVSLWLLVLGALACFGASASAQEETPANTVCPVEGGPVDPSVHVEYKGKRVYFCCPSCKEDFSKNPEKYLVRLPQFGGAPGKALAEGKPEHGEEHEAGPAQFIEPLGILTLSLLILTASAGLFMKKSPRVLLKCHKALAAATVTSALCHALLVMLWG
jgi:YHS domain-containing protein